MGLGNAKPTEPDKRETQNVISSQSGLSRASFKRHVITIMYIKHAWVKKSTSDLGKVTELQNIQLDPTLSSGLVSDGVNPSSTSIPCSVLIKLEKNQDEDKTELEGKHNCYVEV